MDYDATPTGDTRPTPIVRRGRPVKMLPHRQRELRLTPTDKRPIEWFTQDGIIKIVAFEEGGPGTEKALHYHCLVETTLSDEMLKRYCYTLTRGKGTEGNKAFMSKEPHENTNSYISKHRQVAYNVGYPESDLQSWYTKSDEYVSALKRERDTHRKIKALGRKRELLSVEQDIQNELKSFPVGEHPSCLTNYIIERFLQECRKRSYDFPTRTQMEGIVNRLRYDYNPAVVLAFYRRNLNIDMEYNTHNGLHSTW